MGKSMEHLWKNHLFLGGFPRHFHVKNQSVLRNAPAFYRVVPSSASAAQNMGGRRGRFSVRGKGLEAFSQRQLLI